MHRLGYRRCLLRMLSLTSKNQHNMWLMHRLGYIRCLLQLLSLTSKIQHNMWLMHRLGYRKCLLQLLSLTSKNQHNIWLMHRLGYRRCLLQLLSFTSNDSSARPHTVFFNTPGWKPLAGIPLLISWLRSLGGDPWVWLRSLGFQSLPVLAWYVSSCAVLGFT